MYPKNKQGNNRSWNISDFISIWSPSRKNNRHKKPNRKKTIRKNTTFASSLTRVRARYSEYHCSSVRSSGTRIHVMALCVCMCVVEARCDVTLLASVHVTRVNKLPWKVGSGFVVPLSIAASWRRYTTAILTQFVPTPTDGNGVGKHYKQYLYFN